MISLSGAFKLPLIVVGVLIIIFSGCQAKTTTPSVRYTLPELEYRLMVGFGEVFWCDPDFYPIGRPEQENINSLEQFATIRAGTAEFSAILAQLGLPDRPEYSNEEKLLIYREHKKLAYALQVAVSGDVHVRLHERSHGLPPHCRGMAQGRL